MGGNAHGWRVPMEMVGNEVRIISSQWCPGPESCVEYSCGIVGVFRNFSVPEVRILAEHLALTEVIGVRELLLVRLL